MNTESSLGVSFDSNEIVISDCEASGSQLSDINHSSWKSKNFNKNGKNLTCKVCKKDFSFKTGHSSLKYHIQSHGKPLDINQTKLTTFFKPNEQLSKASFDDLLINFVVSGQHPFSIVGEYDFIKLIHSLDSNINIMSRFTLKRKCLKTFEEYQKKVISKLRNIESKVSLTTDIWTSITRDSYVVITAHFMENNLLNQLLIEFCLIPSPHTAENIKNKIIENIEKYSLTDKVMAITTDNARNVIKAMSDIYLWLECVECKPITDTISIRCFAHVLNLAVQEGINRIEMDYLRSFISEIKSSPKHKQLFEKTAEELKIKFIKLKSDVKTRWNSYYDMLDRALKMKNVLNHLKNENKDFNKYKEKINPEFWKFCEELCDFLKIFYESTLLISRSKYPTLSIVLPIFDNLMVNLNAIITKNDQINPIASLIKNKLEEYEDYLKNDLTIFATILDPRCKLVFFENYPNYDSIKTKFCNIYNMNYKKETESDQTPDTFQHQLFKRKRIDKNEELSQYLNTPVESNVTIDPINWWNCNKYLFPNLSKMAFDFHVCMASSVPSEQAFSKSGELITNKRNSLEKDSIKSLMLLNSWLGKV